MHILIYGAKGWIGSQFIAFLDNERVIAAQSSTLSGAVEPHLVHYTQGLARVDNVAELREEITRVNPTHIFSLIGRTSGIHNGTVYSTIDFLEQEGNLQLNVRDNLFSPVVLALLCKELGIHFAYLGTGCIFDYPSENGFTEEDLPNFTGSSYSTVKGYTDRLMHMFDDTALNLRIRMPITNRDNPRNFISKIIRYEKICSIPNSMTVLTDFYPVWLDMIRNKKTGTYNCTNPGVISHNEILQHYKDLVDPNFTWQNFSIEEQNQILASKRSNNYLCTIKLESEYPSIPNIQKSVFNVLENWDLAQE